MDGSYDHPEIDKVIAPHENTIRPLIEGRKGPDGKFTGEQLEEWWGWNQLVAPFSASKAMYQTL